VNGDKFTYKPINVNSSSSKVHPVST
jgi:hypothetical protein